MRDYLVIEAAPGDDLVEWRDAEALVLASGGWTKVAERRRFSVFVEGERPPPYRHLPGVGGALIGDVFEAEAARQGYGLPLDLMGFGGSVDDNARRLVAKAYGRYVAILNDDRQPVRVLRDPLGAMDAIGWRRGGLRFIGSRLPDLPELWPETLAIDWSALARILRQKNLASLICPLVGVTSYPPGTLASSSGEGPALWSPARFAKRPWSDADPAALRHVIDGVVAAWAHERPAFCEISGGLDSAIVASSLAQAKAAIAYGVNHSFPREEGDERAYARAVADVTGFPLKIVERTSLVLTPEKLVGAAGGPRPNYVGGDPDHDADLADRLRADGIEAMFTGRGGDGVLYQSGHPALARDVVRGAVAGPRFAALSALARRNATTVWAILKRGFSRMDLTEGLGVQIFLSPGAAAPKIERHPWLVEAQVLSPAKQLQVLALVNGLSGFGESQRHRAGDVIDPLMSQPVVEFCLSTGAGRLAVGGNDRPFARAAFADRLPPLVLNRRGKGNVTTFIAKVLGDNLGMLRPYLLEGQLAQAGLIDREALEAGLTHDRLAWTNITSEVFVLLAVEAWARQWSQKLALTAPSPQRAATS